VSLALEQFMDESISLRKAEIGDIEQIKAILFSSLKEYDIAIPDNYSVADIDSIKFKEAVWLYKRNSFLELKEVQISPGHDLAFEKHL
jgi:hypothetical protein